jgi:hypothetical protein
VYTSSILVGASPTGTRAPHRDPLPDHGRGDRVVTPTTPAPADARLVWTDPEAHVRRHDAWNTRPRGGGE